MSAPRRASTGYAAAWSRCWPGQYARYADLIWVETGTSDLGLAREFATELHREFPGKKLAYNCSPSFNWRSKLSDAEIATFQDELGDLGYAFQFITLAGFHALNHSMFTLAQGYSRTGMSERQRANHQHSQAGARSGATEFARCLGWAAA